MEEERKRKLPLKEAFSQSVVSLSSILEQGSLLGSFSYSQDVQRVVDYIGTLPSDFHVTETKESIFIRSTTDDFDFLIVVDKSQIKSYHKTVPGHKIFLVDSDKSYAVDIIRMLSLYSGLAESTFQLSLFLPQSGEAKGHVSVAPLPLSMEHIFIIMHEVGHEISILGSNVYRFVRRISEPQARDIILAAEEDAWMIADDCLKLLKRKGFIRYKDAHFRGQAIWGINKYRGEDITEIIETGKRPAADELADAQRSAFRIHLRYLLVRTLGKFGRW
ncbi:MAG: hypothetical protein PHS44_03255 [Candidatus Dojkabacteria bacterium]|nr:hypothetical protein [Candidatus Dojkabacteria bacterium]